MKDLIPTEWQNLLREEFAQQYFVELSPPLWYNFIIPRGGIDMKITWLGHACFLVESADGSFVFDPYEPGYVPGLQLPELKADLCLCSHGHGDHSYYQAVSLSAAEHELNVHRFHRDTAKKKG